MSVSWVALGALLAAVGDEGPLAFEDCPPEVATFLGDELAVAGIDLREEQLMLRLACAEGTVGVRVSTQRNDRAASTAFTLASGDRAMVRLSVQVVDFLHAFLSEDRFRGLLVLRAPAPMIQAPPPLPPSPWSGVLVAGVISAPGAFAIQPHFHASLVHRLGPLDVGLGLGGTLNGARIEGPEGVGIFGLVTAQAVAQVPFHFDRVSLVPRVAAGVLIGWATGERPTSNYEVRTGATSTASFSVSLAAWARVLATLSLGVLIDVSVSPVPVRITVPGVQARLGLPLLAFSVGARFQ